MACRGQLPRHDFCIIQMFQVFACGVAGPGFVVDSPRISGPPTGDLARIPARLPPYAIFSPLLAASYGPVFSRKWPVPHLSKHHSCQFVTIIFKMNKYLLFHFFLSYRPSQLSYGRAGSKGLSFQKRRREASNPHIS